jgi:hypothetical protein
MKVTIQPDAAETLLDCDSDSKSPLLKRTVEDGESVETDIPKNDINDILGFCLGIDGFDIDDLSDFEDINSYYKHELQQLKNSYANGELTEFEFENKVEELLSNKVEYE